MLSDAPWGASLLTRLQILATLPPHRPQPASGSSLAVQAHAYIQEHHPATLGQLVAAEDWSVVMPSPPAGEPRPCEASPEASEVGNTAVLTLGVHTWLHFSTAVTAPQAFELHLISLCECGRFQQHLVPTDRVLTDLLNTVDQEQGLPCLPTTCPRAAAEYLLKETS